VFWIDQTSQMAHNAVVSHLMILLFPNMSGVFCILEAIHLLFLGRYLSTLLLVIVYLDCLSP